MMKQRSIILIISCALLSTAVVIMLFFLSEDMIHRNNSFLRQFPPHVITEGRTVDIEYDSYYIAGATKTEVYLGNYTSPRNVTVVNTISLDTQHVVLDIKNAQSLKIFHLILKVDSPDFFLTDGGVPLVFEGKVNDWRATQRHAFDSAYFIDSEPISRNSFAMRYMLSSTKEYTLGKQTQKPHHVQFASGLLQKQVDGRFCVDGMLHYDKEMRWLVYLYYYRNQYIVADTNLNLIHRGRTIDTVSHARIKVAEISRTNSRTLAAPPLIVNKMSSVSAGRIFVNSSLISKTENKNTFDNASVIDVYNLRNREYKFSFYIFDYKGNKIRDLQIVGDKLIVLIDHYITVYGLQSYYFQKE